MVAAVAAGERVAGLLDVRQINAGLAVGLVHDRIVAEVAVIFQVRADAAGAVVVGQEADAADAAVQPAVVAVVQDAAFGVS